MRQRQQRAAARRAFRPTGERVEGRPLMSATRATARTEATALAYAVAHTPPVIIRTVEVVDSGQVVALQITFSKPVNPSGLNDLSHYAVQNLSPNGLPDPPVSAAAYNPAQNSLVLTLATPMPPGPLMLTSPGYAVHPSAAFVKDFQGRPLKTLGGDFLVSFQSKGPDLSNAVPTPYPVLNRLDGAYRYNSGYVDTSGQDKAQTIFAISKLSAGGALGLLYYL